MKKDTIIRTVLLALALINQILTSTGKNPLLVDNNTITELISLLFTVGTAVWAWWKNNSFTKEAIAADDVLKKLKTKGMIEESEPIEENNSDKSDEL